MTRCPRVIAERECQAVLAHLEQEIDGFVGASFVDAQSGRALAVHCVRPEYPLSSISAHAGELVRHKDRALRAAGVADELEEMLVTTRERLHLYKLLGSDVLLYVTAAREETTLALLKTVVQRRADELADLTRARHENVA